MLKAGEVEVRPFTLINFSQVKAEDKQIRGISKKELKSLAQKIGLAYDDKQINFAKKLMIAYFK